MLLSSFGTSGRGMKISLVKVVIFGSDVEAIGILFWEIKGVDVDEISRVLNFLR